MNKESDILSAQQEQPLEVPSESQLYNLSSNQKQLQNKANFVTLSQISEENKIEIIQKGFQLNQEGKISLKKYYESTDHYSLFKWKGFQMKYESLRKTPFFKELRKDFQN